MIRKIVQVPIDKFNTVVTITVPEESYLLSVENIHDAPVLFFIQPVTPKKKDRKTLTITIDVLCIHGSESWSDVVGEGLRLSYIGAAVCDAGYRVYHVFEVVEEEGEFNEEDFRQLVEDLREETPEGQMQIAVEETAKTAEPKIEIKEGGEVKDGILTYTEK